MSQISNSTSHILENGSSLKSSVPSIFFITKSSHSPKLHAFPSEENSEINFLNFTLSKIIFLDIQQIFFRYKKYRAQNRGKAKARKKISFHKRKTSGGERKVSHSFFNFDSNIESSFRVFLVFFFHLVSNTYKIIMERREKGKTFHSPRKNKKIKTFLFLFLFFFLIS
jgi:hypothetical protein